MQIISWIWWPIDSDDLIWFYVCCTSVIIREVGWWYWWTVLLQPVKNIIVGSNKKVEGVVLEDGREIRSQLVLSNATAKVTFLHLLETVRLSFQAVNLFILEIFLNSHSERYSIFDFCCGVHRLGMRSSPIYYPWPSWLWVLPQKSCHN